MKSGQDNNDYPDRFFFKVFYFVITGRGFLAESISTPIPNSMSMSPAHDGRLIRSPKKKTPSIVAVSGSASDKVTAVEDDTLNSPVANK